MLVTAAGFPVRAVMVQPAFGRGHSSGTVAVPPTNTVAGSTSKRKKSEDRIRTFEDKRSVLNLTLNDQLKYAWHPALELPNYLSLEWS